MKQPASVPAEVDLPHSLGFAEQVIAWWGEHRAERDALPWRSTRDPWRVLVSEMMLAQTQISRVAGRYGELIDRFPTPAACAEAPLGDVLRMWEGLGYNRRAMSLHGAARRIVDDHAGSVPRTLDELLALPGVGPYTARAVLAFAFDADVAVVDTNIRRVIARAILGRAATPAALQSAADALLVCGRGRDWNLALMDFGSLVCSARSPGCDGCRVRQVNACEWRRSGDDADPAIAQALVVGRQGTFEGSDRQGRGRLIKAACDHPIRLGDVASVTGWLDDPTRALRVVGDLCREGLLVEEPSGWLRLP